MSTFFYAPLPPSSFARANRKEPPKKKKAASVTSSIPNSFLLFSNEHRAKLIKEHPDCKNTEISKILGDRWKNLHPDQKKISFTGKSTKLATFW
jgi:hypothetical protein